MSNEIKTPKELQYVHLVVMFYLFIAGYTDGKITDEEAFAIKALTKTWLPDGTSDADVHKIVMEAYDWYASLTSEQFQNVLAGSTDMLKENYSAEGIKALIEDVEKIAKADGRYSKGEKHNVNIIKQAFGVS